MYPDVACVEPAPSPLKSNRPNPLLSLKQFYRAAKRQAWDVTELGWDHLPPVPSAEKERWRLLWASIVEQQLQADRIAINLSTKLLLQAPEHEAKMYYSTMVQDEARHVEGWTRLSHMLEAVEAENPYLTELGERFDDVNLLEEQVLGFQVIFEGAALFSIKDISESTENIILGEMAKKLVRDDAIHHNSGVAYSHYLLGKASRSFRKHISEKLKVYGPIYTESLTWRPPARQWMCRFMENRDRETIRRNHYFINKALVSLGIDPMFDM